MGMWDNDDQNNSDEINSVSERFKSCFPYILPILDGDHFGKFVYARVPPLGFVDAVLVRPLEQLYHAIPFAGLAFFLLLSFGVSRNQSFSRNVRFNAQQAILLDIALIFPDLLGSMGPGGMPMFLVEPLTTFVYYFLVATVGYSVVSNLGGKKPNQIPIFSDAAEMQIGPS